MISDRVRNSFVGLTMLAAIAAFMVAAFKLDTFTTFAHGRPYVISLSVPDAGGVTPGNSVTLNGVPIGTVSDVVLSKDLDHVELTLSIRQDMKIPVKVDAVVGKPPTLGTAFVSLHWTPAAAPTYLPTDGSAHITGTTKDSDLIPKKTTDTLTTAAEDISTLAKKLSALSDGLADLPQKIASLSDNLNGLLAKQPLADFEKQDPSTRVANISILVQRVDHFIHDADSLIGDADSQAGLRLIVKNLGDASAKLDAVLTQADSVVKSANTMLDKVGASADQIGGAATQASSTLRVTEGQIVRTTEKLNESLNSLNTILANLSKGKGSAGQLLNDSRLYEGMIDLTTSLKQTSDELNLLVQKWKEEGLPLHLK